MGVVLTVATTVLAHPNYTNLLIEPADHGVGRSHGGPSGAPRDDRCSIPPPGWCSPRAGGRGRSWSPPTPPSPAPRGVRLGQQHHQDLVPHTVSGEAGVALPRRPPRPNSVGGSRHGEPVRDCQNHCLHQQPEADPSAPATAATPARSEPTPHPTAPASASHGQHHPPASTNNGETP